MAFSKFNVNMGNQMGRLLTVVQKLVIIAVWLITLALIIIGLAYIVDSSFQPLIGYGFIIGGALVGFILFKLVNWIFKKNNPQN
jgi:hypothetical protein